MKKILLAVITAFGVGTLAHADSITLVQGNSNGSVKINGENAYLYLVQIALSPGETINSGAQIDFISIELTTSGGKDMVNADLVNYSGGIASTTYNDNDDSGNYFTEKKLTGSSSYTSFYNTYGTLGEAIGSPEHFSAPTYTWVNGHKVYTYDTKSWSVDLTDTQIAEINADGGVFDIGIDPDCVYDVLGSITFCYSTSTPQTHNAPDTGMTAGLLGMSFLGLLAFRRKLALA